MSGVLAVVALGLYMGKNGRTRISPEVEHFLSEFWELLAYFGNTVIFVVAGVMIVYDLGSTRVGGVVAVRAVDFGHLMIFYVACTVQRETSNGAPHAATARARRPAPRRSRCYRRSVRR